MKYRNLASGFTILEIVVVTAIIGLLAGFLYSSISEARAIARDNVRLAELQQLQVAIEAYKDTYGEYPDMGTDNDCGPGTFWAGPGPHTTVSWGPDIGCDEYILGLVPSFIAELPVDPRSEDENNLGFLYRVQTVSGENVAYKLINNAVEVNRIESYGEEFARCPRQYDTDPFVPACDGVAPNPSIYAVYSAGGEAW
jgi:prepilin-type N-terminal cleavage/methylation domain-containing protein